MIVGLGTDLCDIRRIDASLTRFGGRFVSRLFTEKERRRAEKVRHRAAVYAKFFAAKEACAKALGTGFRQGVHWRDLGVEALASGKPYMVLSGGAKTRLDKLIPAGRVAVFHLTLTDEFPTAQAIVIISAETPENAALLVA